MPEFNVGGSGFIREPDKKTILIIEDDDVARWTLAKSFKNQNFDVLEVNNGEDGLAIALDKHPDMIVLDLILPKEYGMKVLKTLREDEWGRTASVVILTSLSDPSIISEAAGLGVDDFWVKKDWKPEDVVDKVKQKIIKEWK